MGLVLRVIFEPVALWSSAMFWDLGLVASALAQFVGVAMFAVYIWTRVKIK